MCMDMEIHIKIAAVLRSEFSFSWSLLLLPTLAQSHTECSQHPVDTASLLIWLWGARVRRKSVNSREFSGGLTKMVRDEGAYPTRRGWGSCACSPVILYWEIFWFYSGRYYHICRLCGDLVNIMIPLINNNVHFFIYSAHII